MGFWERLWVVLHGTIFCPQWRPRPSHGSQQALEDLSLKYDLTVRTSAGEVVQFAFGDDGLNPARMEGSASKPLDLQYVMEHVQHVLRPPRHFDPKLGHHQI